MTEEEEKKTSKELDAIIEKMKRVLILKKGKL
jgi:hypothetical protein